MTSATTKPEIEFYQLATLKAALKLEKLGMRHSKLGKIRKRVALSFGLPANIKYDPLIAHIQGVMDEMERKCADNMIKQGEQNV